MLALPLLAAWTVGLATAREQNRTPHWALIAVMPLWANLHGSFAFGLALAGALAVEAIVQASERKKTALAWGLFLLAATASAMATPFGFHTLLFPFQLSGMQSLAHIGEWQPTDLTHLSPFPLALLTSAFVLGSGKIKLAPVRLLLLLGLAGLALAHARHQMLFGVTVPILLSDALAKRWQAKDQSHPPLISVFAALILTGLMAVRLMIPVVRGDDAVSPVSALAHVPPPIRAMPVLNDYGFGGYLIWNGVKVFVDSRADLYGDTFLQNYVRIIAPDRNILAASLNRHKARWTIFPQGSSVAKLMDSMPGWRRFYSDKLATVHIRADMRP